MGRKERFQRSLMGPDSPRKQKRLLGQQLQAGREASVYQQGPVSKLVLGRLKFSAALWRA